MDWPIRWSLSIRTTKTIVEIFSSRRYNSNTTITFNNSTIPWNEYLSSAGTVPRPGISAIIWKVSQMFVKPSEKAARKVPTIV